MYSTEVLSQIQQCELRAQQKEAEIAELKRKFEKQEACRLAVLRECTPYEEGMDAYARKKQNMEAMAHEVRCAKKACDVMHFHQSSQNTILADLAEAEATIRSEKRKTEDLLYEAQNDLSMAEQRLQELQDEYQSALRRESDETMGYSSNNYRGG